VGGSVIGLWRGNGPARRWHRTPKVICRRKAGRTVGTSRSELVIDRHPCPLRLAASMSVARISTVAAQAHRRARYGLLPRSNRRPEAKRSAVTFPQGGNAVWKGRPGAAPGKAADGYPSGRPAAAGGSLQAFQIAGSRRCEFQQALLDPGRPPHLRIPDQGRQRLEELSRSSRHAALLRPGH
jgi:hypothetical protein